jgi:hypothetical protein
MLGTKRCDWCWELEWRIEANVDLAYEILDRIAKRQASFLVKALESVSNKPYGTRAWMADKKARARALFTQALRRDIKRGAKRGRRSA